MKEELYEGQAEQVAGLLAQEETLQQADREKLKYTEDPKERETILRRIAGREGSLSTRRRFLAQLRGEPSEGAREKVVRLRLTDDEYIKVQQSAESDGVTISQYIRSKVL
jgi:hypothetical protein